MDSLDLAALEATAAWLAAGRRVHLITLVRTFGAAPRTPGAWVALRDDGALVGSVSGGCVEDDLIGRLHAGRLEGEDPGRPFLLRYGVTREEASRFGLPCGGSLELLVEPAPDPLALERLREALRAGELACRRLDLRSGATRVGPAGADDGFAFDGERLTTVHGPRLRLLLVGAGQIAEALAPMARMLDYAVTVCDPREEYAATWASEGCVLVTEMPDDAVRAWRPDPRAAVVALSHDPALDDMALLEALASEAFYVGALGSRANQQRRRERLAGLGLPPERIARLRGPVGLPIGGRTPAEIAVSVAADLTAARNGVPLPDWPAKADPE